MFDKSVVKPVMKRVTVPQWGSDVYIRKLSAYDKKELQELDIFPQEKELSKKKAQVLYEKWLFHYVAACVVDEDGCKIFSVEEVQNFDEVPYGFLLIEVLEFNGTAVNLDKAKETLKKALAEGSTTS